ncbi:hypothetical protein VYA_12730 [Vibrio alfacsensis]|nr:hypothetical protein VA249_13980 [Vibrio alfacsensis]BCN24081.1 hypothetical protein VYA_12730 [Vibrio alfacsensis]CAE6944124.1 hypothetical protein ACOMICROBIO_GDFFDHBD_03229 [Vibrio sp. B1REV9]
MGFYTRILVFVGLIFILAIVIVYAVVDNRKDRFEASDIPIGTFEVHMFFERHQNHL